MEGPALSLQGYHGRATFLRNRVSEVKGVGGGSAGPRSCHIPLSYPPKILPPRIPFSFHLPGACLAHRFKGYATSSEQADPQKIIEEKGRYLC